MPFDDRGDRFCASFEYINRMWEDAPTFENPFGNTHGDMDMLPKTTAGKLPLLITGGSQQDPHLDALNPQKVEALIKTIKKVLVELR